MTQKIKKIPKPIRVILIIILVWLILFIIRITIYNSLLELSYGLLFIVVIVLYLLYLLTKNLIKSLKKQNQDLLRNKGVRKMTQKIKKIPKPIREILIVILVLLIIFIIRMAIIQLIYNPLEFYNVVLFIEAIVVYLLYLPTKKLIKSLKK